MKQYLKMADVFRDVVQPERFNYAMANPKATYAAHAVNSHDELVQMNHELLAALEQFTVAQEEKRKDTCRGSHAIARAITKLVMAEEAALAIIAKAKGGAA